MNDSDTRSRAQYEKVRDEFAHLGTQDKTAFVLEATFATIGEAIRETGQHMADLFERVSKDDFWTPPTADEEAPEPPPAPKKTSRRAIAEQAFAAVGRPPRFVSAPDGLLGFNAAAAGALDRRLGELLQFLRAVSLSDAVAPAYGTRRLGPYLEAAA